MRLFCLALLSCALGLSQASVVLTPGMRTIGHALKGVPVGAGAEIELFAFPPGEAGVITEQWFSVFGGTPSGADPTIRVYYDGQGPGTPPSLEYRLFMAHGLGPYGCTDYAGQKNCSDPALRRDVPGDVNAFDNVDGGSWGSELLGHSSTAGALPRL